MSDEEKGNTDVPSTIGGSRIVSDKNGPQASSMALSEITASMATETESSQPLHRLMANGAMPTFKGQARSLIQVSEGTASTRNSSSNNHTSGDSRNNHHGQPSRRSTSATQELPIIEAIAYPEGQSQVSGAGQGGTIVVDAYSSTIESASGSLDTKTRLKATTTASGRRNRTILALIAIVIGILAIVTGGYCASGNCTRKSDKDEFSGNAPFQTSDELRQAVDEYFLAEGSANSNASLKYGYPVGSWDVSRLTNFSSIFDGKRNQAIKSTFDEDLSTWDVSRATDMFRMFAQLDSYTGKGLERWNVSRVTNMRSMFHESFMFKGDVSSWDVSNVASFTRLFSDCHEFNVNISGWNTRNAQDMGWMFFECWVFNQDISRWDVRKVYDFSEMFQRAEVFNVDISGWSVKSATDMQRMFESAIAFNQNLSSWDVSQVNNTYQMFSDAQSFNQSLCSWGSRLKASTNVTAMFNRTNCTVKEDPMPTDENETTLKGSSFCHVC